MNKYVVNIGPDWVALKARSKKTIQKKLKRKRPARIDIIQYKFAGRKYNYAEMNEAEVLTLDEFWLANRPCECSNN